MNIEVYARCMINKYLYKILRRFYHDDNKNVLKMIKLHKVNNENLLSVTAKAIVLRRNQKTPWIWSSESVLALKTPTPIYLWCHGKTKHLFSKACNLYEVEN